MTRCALLTYMASPYGKFLQAKTLPVTSLGSAPLCCTMSPVQAPTGQNKNPPQGRVFVLAPPAGARQQGYGLVK